LIAGYDQRCFHMIALLTELTNRTGFARHTRFTFNSTIYQ
jgi:hypothetical protein